MLYNDLAHPTSKILQVVASYAILLQTRRSINYSDGSLRILIANYEFPPVGGGASKVSFELARTLVKVGHDVVVLTSRCDDSPRLETRDGIIVHRVWSWRKGIHEGGLRGAFAYLVTALPRLRTILNSNRIDVVHYFFGLPTGLLSLYSYSVMNTPYIVSLRGSDVPGYDRDSKKLEFLHRLTKPLSHRIWRRASQVFAVSEGLRELAEVSFPDVQVGVIHNGVDLIDVTRDGGADAGDTPLRLICVSRLIPRKGISDLLRALASLPELNYELTVIGTGPSEAILRGLAETIGIAHKTKFIGYRAREALDAYYTSSDICILPTRSDAFANVILEAMAAALPVIATRVGGVPEAVIDGETGILVNPRRPDQLAAAIQRLADDASLRREFGHAGYQRASDKFSWTENASRHVEAYKRAINSNPTVPARIT